MGAPVDGQVFEAGEAAEGFGQQEERVAVDDLEAPQPLELPEGCGHLKEAVAEVEAELAQPLELPEALGQRGKKLGSDAQGLQRRQLPDILGQLPQLHRVQVEFPKGGERGEGPRQLVKRPTDESEAVEGGGQGPEVFGQGCEVGVGAPRVAPRPGPKLKPLQRKESAFSQVLYKERALTTAQVSTQLGTPEPWAPHCTVLAPWD